MEFRKVYVEVTVRFLKDGGMRPLSLEWEDGRIFRIDKVKRVERACARVGSILPVRYLCVFSGNDRPLYFEGDEMRWFVEAPVGG